jgi:hypothetical protein
MVPTFRAWEKQNGGDGTYEAAMPFSGNGDSARVECFPGGRALRGWDSDEALGRSLVANSNNARSSPNSGSNTGVGGPVLGIAGVGGFEGNL